VQGDPVWPGVVRMITGDNGRSAFRAVISTASDGAIKPEAALVATPDEWLSRFRRGRQATDGAVLDHSFSAVTFVPWRTPRTYDAKKHGSIGASSIGTLTAPGRSATITRNSIATAMSRWIASPTPARRRRGKRSPPSSSTVHPATPTNLTRRTTPPRASPRLMAWPTSWPERNASRLNSRSRRLRRARPAHRLNPKSIRPRRRPTRDRAADTACALALCSA